MKDTRHSCHCVLQWHAVVMVCNDKTWSNCRLRGRVFIVDTLHLFLFMDIRVFTETYPLPLSSFQKYIGMYIHFCMKFQRTHGPTVKTTVLELNMFAFSRTLESCWIFPDPPGLSSVWLYQGQPRVWVRMTSYSSLQSSTAGGSDLLSKCICPNLGYTVSFINYTVKPARSRKSKNAVTLFPSPTCKGFCVYRSKGL